MKLHVTICEKLWLLLVLLKTKSFLKESLYKFIGLTSDPISLLSTKQHKTCAEMVCFTSSFIVQRFKKKKVRPINLLFEFDVVACWDSSKLVVLFVSLIPSIRIAFFRSFNLNFFFPWPKRKQEKRLPCLAYKKVCRDLLMS